jgi:mannose-1-phosphate guanylyltransferase
MKHSFMSRIMLCLERSVYWPSRPETGYGYIEVDKPFDYEKDKVQIKKVKQFREKPDRETAEQFLKAGNYLWNSGMFFWRLDAFIDEMKKALPEVGGKIDEMSSCYTKWTGKPLPEPLKTVAPIFESFPDISIDYGLMERSDNVVVAKALFEWDDIGSWDSLERVRKPDNDGNIIVGDAALIDVSNSVIVNNSTSKKMITTGVKLDNIVIVVTDDAVMVCPKDEVQNVKQVVAKVKEIGDWI